MTDWTKFRREREREMLEFTPKQIKDIKENHAMLGIPFPAQESDIEGLKMTEEKRSGVDRRLSTTQYGGANELQPIDLIAEMGDMEPFCRGNVIKYTARYMKKNSLDDLHKAKTYLNWLYDEVEKKTKDPEYALKSIKDMVQQAAKHYGLPQTNADEIIQLLGVGKIINRVIEQVQEFNLKNKTGLERPKSGLSYGVEMYVNPMDYKCNVCEKPMFDLACQHFPGQNLPDGTVVSSVIKDIKDFHSVSRTATPDHPSHVVHPITHPKDAVEYVKVEAFAGRDPNSKGYTLSELRKRGAEAMAKKTPEEIEALEEMEFVIDPDMDSAENLQKVAELSIGVPVLDAPGGKQIGTIYDAKVVGKSIVQKAYLHDDHIVKTKAELDDLILPAEDNVLTQELIDQQIETLQKSLERLPADTLIQKDLRASAAALYGEDYVQEVESRISELPTTGIPAKATIELFGNVGLFHDDARKLCSLLCKETGMAWAECRRAAVEAYVNLVHYPECAVEDIARGILKARFDGEVIPRTETLSDDDSGKIIRNTHCLKPEHMAWFKAEHPTLEETNEGDDHGQENS